MPKSRFEFNRLNDLRVRQEKPKLSWKEYVNGDEEMFANKTFSGIRKTPRKSFYNFDIEPDQPTTMLRPKASYDNAGYNDIYKKYGV